MNENRDILLKLLSATTASEVTKLVNNDLFFKNVKWLPYGGFPNNVGTVEGQMKKAENALIEKVSNSIDAILIRKCLEEGVDPKDKNKAPNSMKEAIDRYFGGREKLREERSEIAKKFMWLVAEGKKERPTITIIDAGEGQTPDRIKDTILSLHAQNKSKISFVFGKYNQGGASPLGFAGDPSSYYENYLQLILCRRAQNIDDIKNKKTEFGFSLVRKRFDRETESYTYEYMVNKNEDIISVPFDGPIKICGYNFIDGCIIRLYEYQLNKPGYIVFRGLNEFIEKKLAEIPIPLYLLEMRQYKGDTNYTIFGLKEKLLKKKEALRISYPHKIPVDLGQIGKRDADIFILEHKTRTKDKDIGSYLDESEKIFFLKDGMVLHSETITWLRNQCDLPDLAPYLFIFIDISNINPALAQMLHSGRESFKDHEITRLVLERLKIFLNNDTFKELNKEYSILTGTQNTEDHELKKQLIKDVAKSQELRELFEVGEDFTFKKEEPGEEDTETEYEGNYLPEKFELIGSDIREIEENSFAKVTFETEAENNLLERSEDRGEYDWDKTDKFQITFNKYKKGKLTFRIDPKKGLVPGESEEVKFYLKVPSKSLTFKSKVMFSLKEKQHYVGEYFPTFFNPIKKLFKIPIKSIRKLRFTTDVENNYFSRNLDRGVINFEKHKALEFGRTKLKDGVLEITIKCIKNKKRKIDNILGNIFDGKNKFIIDLKSEIIQIDTEPRLNLPKPTKIFKDNWEKETPIWNESIIARIPSWGNLSEIKINMDSLPFENLKIIKMENRDQIREQLFRQLYISAIWLFFELKDLKPGTVNVENSNLDCKDLIFEKTIRANAKHLLQNIKKLIR